MTGLNTRILRAFARVFRAQAIAAKQPLGDYLLSRLVSRVATVEEGRLLVGFGDETGNSNYSPTSELTQSRVLECISDLADRWDKALADLVAAGTAEPTQEAIWTRFMADLVPVREFFSDHSGARSL